MFAHPSSLDMMKQSKCFKTMFVLSVSSMMVGLLLCVIFPLSNCGYKTVKGINCQELSNVYTFQRNCFEKTYCCSQYASCGDYYYCFIRAQFEVIENHEQRCIATLIVGIVFLSLSVLFAIATIIIFKKLKQRLHGDKLKPVPIKYVQAVIVGKHQEHSLKAISQPQQFFKLSERDLLAKETLGIDEKYERLN